MIQRKSFLYFPILLLLFFPYVTPYSFGSDIQPWAIIFVFLMSIFLFFKNIKLNYELSFLWLPLLLSIGLLTISPDMLSGIRSVLGYLTISLVPLTSYFLLRDNQTLFEKFVKGASLIYCAIGLIQTFVNKEFMLFLLNTIRTSNDRGVTSLAVEPTFYGLICLFLILIFLALNIQYKNRYICLLVFQIIFLSQSTMTILLLLMFCIYYFLFKLNLKFVFLGSLFLFLAYLLIIDIGMINQNIRFFAILRLVLENPSQLIAIDQSINFRLADIYFSLKGFVDSYMIPNGFGAYQAFLSSELPQQKIFTGGSGWVTSSNRISSYYGALLFELGFVGLIIPFVYSFIIIKSYRNQVRDLLLYVFFLNTVLLTAIPLSFTFVGIYMATLLHKANNTVK